MPKVRSMAGRCLPFSKMSNLVPQIFLLLALSSVSFGLVQMADSTIEMESLTNDSVKDLKRYEYSHVVQDLEQDLNCSKYSVHHDYVLLENSSLHLLGSNTTHDRDRFFLQNDTVFLCLDEDLSDTDTHSSHNYSKEFLECGHVLIENDEYKLLENGNILIEVYSRTYEPSDYYRSADGVYICIPEFKEMRNGSHNGTIYEGFNKFPEAFTYVTITGLVISIISLLSHLVVFCAVASVRNLPGCCLASLSLSLLIAYICFLIVALINTGSSCSEIGLCVYYFFLTSFFWMNAIAFDVWRSFRVVVKELRISSHRVPRRRFFLYSLYSWTIPGVLAVVVKVFDSSELLPEDLRPSFGDDFCWFGQRRALLVFFAVPLIVVMILNAVFFLDVTYVISRATLKTSRSHEATLRKRFWMFMKLALIMGLTWIVGLVASSADSIFVWYLFVILNTLQGLFIFVVFSCSTKVRGQIFKKWRKDNLKRGSTSVRTISQTSAAV